jgi:hypothetical protein
VNVLIVFHLLPLSPMPPGYPILLASP